MSRDDSALQGLLSLCINHSTVLQSTSEVRHYGLGSGTSQGHVQRFYADPVKIKVACSIPCPTHLTRSCIAVGGLVRLIL